ncbi:PTS galactitol transporter subunit IIC [Spirochaetia bacterium]|nr:PTS galactitol transporter subunit IIC [Spirochaetia bacterium]
MQEWTYTITDANGIHARPAGILVEQLQKFNSVVTISLGDKSCDGKRLFALMKLRVKNGNTISVKIQGDDEEAAAATAKKFLQENL